MPGQVLNQGPGRNDPVHLVRPYPLCGYAGGDSCGGDKCPDAGQRPDADRWAAGRQA